MRFLFACGGTAGHINPALSIASELKGRIPDAQIRFAGNPAGMEARLVAKAGFDFVPFRAMGLQRKLTLPNVGRNIRSAGLLLTAQPRAARMALATIRCSSRRVLTAHSRNCRRKRRTPSPIGGVHWRNCVGFWGLEAGHGRWRL